MTAAELLRSLDKAATARPWEQDDPNLELVGNRGPQGEYQYVAATRLSHGPGWPREVEEANARLITTTRNLLPLLAGLVEAVGRHEELMGMIRRRGKQATMEAIMEARGGISAAYAALEAAAAKEGTK